MGIRPTFHLIYGIDNLKVNEETGEIIDVRYDGREFDWSMEVPLIKSTKQKSLNRDKDVWLSNQFLTEPGYDPEKKTRRLYEVLIHKTEGGLPGVIGFIIEKESDLSLWWAFSGLNETYSQPGYSVVPEATYHHHHLKAIQDLFKQCDKQKKSKFSLRPYLKLFRWELYGRRKHIIYPHFLDTTVDAWRKTALHLFRTVGLKGIRDRDLKLMIYWTWD